MPTPIAPERRPLEIDVHDDDETRRWLAELVYEQVAARREPVPAVHLLFDGYEEVLEWHRVVAVDPGADLPATWAVLAARPGADRRVLVLRLEHPDGTTEAGMYEETWEDGAPVAWWFGHRRYTVVDGIGQLADGGWDQHAGVGPAPEPFATILRPAPGARAAILLPARAPEPRVWMQSGEVTPGARLPTTAIEMTGETQQVVLQMMARGEGFKRTLVHLLRGTTWELWLLGDALPTDVDDMVRWICGRLGPADAVTTAEALIGPVGGKPGRVIRILGELGGRRAERMIILLPKPGKPEDVVPGQVMGRDLGAVAEGEGWIGVAPVLPGEIFTTVMGYGPVK